MGITGFNGNSENTEQTNDVGQNQQASNHAFGNAGGVESLGFGSNLLTPMPTVQGGDYTQRIAKAIEKVYAETKFKPGINPNIDVFDKMVISGIAYSCIVISLKYQEVLYYFNILLEATGDRIFTAGDMVNEIQQVERASFGNPKPLIYTPDDANDAFLHRTIIAPHLTQSYQVKKLTPVDGMIYPAEAPESSICVLASEALKAVYTELALANKLHADLDITAAKAKSTGYLKVDAIYSTGISINPFATPIRSDWRLNLYEYISQTKQEQSINVQDNKRQVNSVAGYVDSIPITKVDNNNMPFIRLAPHIIITNVQTKDSTPGNTLLSILTSLIMIERSMWLPALPTKSSKHQVGALNIYTDLGNQVRTKQKQVPDRYDFSKTQEFKDSNQIAMALNNMYTENPQLSIDVPVLGPETYYLSILSAAANLNNPELARAASKEIIDSAHWLTGGKFPKDFPTDGIFNGPGVVIPLGTWSDSSGEKDIREIDLSFLACHTNDNDLINEYALSNYNGNNIDTFISRIKVIAKLVKDAKIKGKATRLTFTRDFIDALSAASLSAGLQMTYTPTFTFKDHNNINFITSYTRNAGLTNNISFARQNIQQGIAWNTNYGNAGYNRFF